MTPRTPDQIRLELAYWKARQLAERRARRPIEAAYCAILAGALAWALGATPSPATRIDPEK